MLPSHLDHSRDVAQLTIDPEVCGLCSWWTTEFQENAPSRQRSYWGESMVQLWSSNCFQGRLKLLLGAIRVAVFQLVTGESFAVTAEAADSSPRRPHKF
jgi:hypothetical protein